MKTSSDFELPKDLIPKHKKAVKLEWITIFYLLSVVTLMYLVMGNSQAMKTAWLEDLMSLIPALSFLIASIVSDRKPTEEFPFGFHKIFSIANTVGAFALFAIGIFLLVDSSIVLIKQERPTIGTIEIFGENIWMGYIMIAVLLYSSIPAMILGRKKLPLARQLHNKVLFTDADTQKADWVTALAAIVGILGIGFGIWWADATAALIISFSILKDGLFDLIDSIKDAMDQAPRTIENKEMDPLVENLRKDLGRLPFVKEVEVRMRDAGQVLFCEVFFVPDSERDLIEKIAKVQKTARGFDWKVQNVVVMALDELR